MLTFWRVGGVRFQVIRALAHRTNRSGNGARVEIVDSSLRELLPSSVAAGMAKTCDGAPCTTCGGHWHNASSRVRGYTRDDMVADFLAGVFFFCSFDSID